MKGFYQCFGHNIMLYCQKVEVLEVGSILTSMAMEVLWVIISTCQAMMLIIMVLDSSSGLASMGVGGLAMVATESSIEHTMPRPKQQQNWSSCTWWQGRWEVTIVTRDWWEAHGQTKEPSQYLPHHILPWINLKRTPCRKFSMTEST